MSIPSSLGLNSINTTNILSSLWISDAGASHHMSLSSSFFVFMSQSPSPTSVRTADCTHKSSAGDGSICLPHLFLSNVYCVPKLSMNLVFVSQLCNSSYYVSFYSTSCEVQDPQSQALIGKGHWQG